MPQAPLTLAALLTAILATMTLAYFLFTRLAKMLSTHLQQISMESRAEADIAGKMKQLIEATNTTTLSLQAVEKALREVATLQLGLRQSLSNSSRSKATGENPPPASDTIGRQTFITATPTTRLPDGREGFVTESGEARPLEKPSVRDLARTEAT